MPLFDQFTPRLLRGLFVMVSLIIVGVVLRWLNFGKLLETNWINAEIRGQGIYGGVLFIGVGSLFTALGLPRQLVSFFGGYAFGFLTGTCISLFATLVGALIALQYSRLMGRTFFTHHFPRHIKRIDDFLAKQTITTILVLRFSPFTNNLITNLAAGISGIRIIPFLIGSALGYLPQTLIFALLGSGFTLDPEIRIGISILLFLSSTICSIWLWNRYRSD